MKPEEQLDEWIKGNSIHNIERDECCPDFSCCKPELLADLNIRIKFKESNWDIRYKMLGMFLGKLLENEKVYISDGIENNGIQ